MYFVLQIGRVLGNPAVLQDMAQGVEMATGSASAMMSEFWWNHAPTLLIDHHVVV